MYIYIRALCRVRKSSVEVKVEDKGGGAGAGDQSGTGQRLPLTLHIPLPNQCHGGWGCCDTQHSCHPAHFESLKRRNLRVSHKQQPHL